MGGPLVPFHVDIGQRVDRGEVVARIDPRDFEVKVMRLCASLAEAQANLKAMKKGARDEDIALLEAQLKANRVLLLEAENQHARYEALASGKSIFQSEYDHAKASFETAKAQVDAAVQELKKARAGSREEDIEAAQAGITSLRADLKAATHALADTRLTAGCNPREGNPSVLLNRIGPKIEAIALTPGYALEWAGTMKPR